MLIKLTYCLFVFPHTMFLPIIIFLFFVKYENTRILKMWKWWINIFDSKIIMDKSDFLRKGENYRVPRCTVIALNYHNKLTIKRKRFSILLYCLMLVTSGLSTGCTDFDIFFVLWKLVSLVWSHLNSVRFLKSFIFVKISVFVINTAGYNYVLLVRYCCPY